MAAVKQHELGTPVADIVRKLRVAEQTFYRWKSSTEVWKPPTSANSRGSPGLIDHDPFDSVRAPARAMACALDSARVVLPEPATPWVAARV